MIHELTERTETAISQMLYDDIRNVLISIFGEYDASKLRTKIPEYYHRDSVRNWLKKTTPDWIFKRRVGYGKIWAIRNAYEILYWIKSDELKKVGMNFHTTFNKCAYEVGPKTYTSERDEDIMYYLMKD